MSPTPGLHHQKSKLNDTAVSTNSLPQWHTREELAQRDYLKKPCYGINFKISKIMQNRQLEKIKRTYYDLLPNVWGGKHKEY
jgi:DNA polymerase I-like protein with 3'-5' exonuclease and polymerase domains